MTDHADTIRRDAALKALMELDGIDRVQAVAEDPSLLDYVAEVVAERQQAIDRAEEAERDRDYFNRRLGDFAAVAETDRARCEQAIDALREIADHVPGRYVVQSPDYVQLKARARAALLNLGEQ